MSSSAGGAGSGSTASSRRRRASSLRHRSTSRREATVINQPRGLSGTPLDRPLDRGGEQCLLDGVLARAEVAVTAHERAEGLRRQLAQQALDAGAGSHISVPDVSIIGRTSIAPKRELGQRTAISVARSGLSTSTIR